MLRTLFLLLFLKTAILFSQPLNDVQPYYIGHSLINLNVPAMVRSLAADAGKSTDYAYQIGNGANLWWQWDTLQGNEQGIPWQDALPTGQFDAVVVTEAVPLLGQLIWSKTHAFADSFLTTALNYRPDARFFVYETWHCNTTGTPTGCPWDEDDDLLWRPRLTADWPLWTGIMDSLKLKHPAVPVWMIPAGQAFAMLTDSIEAGKVPGVSDYKTLFSDDIHLTEMGNYFVACVMYSCLFRESPEGRTNQTFSEWGVPFSPPSTELALKMQQIAWKTVTNLSAKTGVGAVSSIFENEKLDGFDVFPNPGRAGDEVSFISNKGIERVEIFDAQGCLVHLFFPKNGERATFKTGSAGLFFVTIGFEDGAIGVRKLVVD